MEKKIEDLILEELRKAKEATRLERGAAGEDADFPACALEVVEGPDAGKTFPLLARETALGRGPQGIVLRDIDVSRLHAVFEIQDEGQVLLRDQGSTNGTYVNGVRVADTTLKSGDEIKFGSTKCRFTLKKSGRQGVAR